ncbi:MAG TPA: hypothetical protein VK550_11165 [Polyangiaceae bacterium]|nr:hypothetical protein [Polyangiaceae bacterium]
MSNWNPLVTPIDYILLTRKKSPGLAEIVGASQPRKWDERPGYGLSGAFIVYTGTGLAHFSVHVHLFTVADWDAWNIWKQLIAKPPSGLKPEALDIWHPFLEDLGIKAVVVEDQLQPVDVGNGEWVHEIKFVQFRMPTPAVCKPMAAKSEPEPEDSVDRTIKNLYSRIQLFELAP